MARPSVRFHSYSAKPFRARLYVALLTELVDWFVTSAKLHQIFTFTENTAAGGCMLLITIFPV